jgi:hypothetical protein
MYFYASNREINYLVVMFYDLGEDYFVYNKNSILGQTSH